MPGVRDFPLPPSSLSPEPHGRDVAHRLLAQLLAEGLAVQVRVSGHSMVPFLRPGDVVTLTPRPQRSLYVGDVVVVRFAARDVRVHRVVLRTSEGLVTRGDASRRADPPAKHSQVLARVSQVLRQERSRRLGLGPERVLVAWLSRLGLLTPVGALYRLASHDHSCARRSAAAASGRNESS